MIKSKTIVVPALLFMFLFLAASAAVAQETPTEQPNSSDNKTQFGIGLTAKIPYEDFGNEVKTGYGISGLLVHPLMPVLDLTADIGWNHFSAGDTGKSLDIWEFVGGMRFRLGVFFMSGEVAYYTEIDETSFLPGLGLKFTNWELAWNVRAVSGGSWTGLRLGYYF